MKHLLCAVLFLLVIIQSFARSSVPQAERRPRKGGAFGVKRYVPQAEHPNKRSLFDNLFDPHAQAEQDQDVCMWRCQEWCSKRCKGSNNEECLDGCLNIYGYRWRRCLRKCKRGDLDRPGGGEESEEEEEEEEEEE